MKKIFAILLTSALLATATLPAFAANSQKFDETDSGQLNVEYEFKKGKLAADRVCVDIEWEEMKFTYKAGNSSYNAEDHKTTVENGSWNTEKKSIKVTNHSNVSVNAGFDFSGTNSITGAFYDASADGDNTTYTENTNKKFALSTGENLTGAENFTPPSSKIYLGITGGAITQDTPSIGTVTVSIARKKVETVTSVEEFKTALAAGYDIKLGGDKTTFSVNEELSVTSDVTIDLNGHTLQAWLKTVAGTPCIITVTDSSETAEGMIKPDDSDSNTVNPSYAIDLVNEGDVLHLIRGTIDILNNLDNGVAIQGVTGSTVVIDGGEVASNGLNAIVSSGNVIVNGGRIIKIIKMTGGTLTVNGGYIIDAINLETSGNKASRATVNDGFFRDAFSVNKGCTLDIKGGTIATTNSHPIVNYGITTIENAKFLNEYNISFEIANTRDEASDPAPVMTIKSGIFEFEIQNEGTLTITGGTFYRSDKDFLENYIDKSTHQVTANTDGSNTVEEISQTKG